MSLVSVKHCELNTELILACWLGGLLLLLVFFQLLVLKLCSMVLVSTTHLPPPLACALIRLAGVVWISFICDEERHVCGGRLDLFLAEPPALSARLRRLRLRLPGTRRVDRGSGHASRFRAVSHRGPVRHRCIEFFSRKKGHC
jgi:hypothetical protein